MQVKVRLFKLKAQNSPIKDNYREWSV